MKILLTVIVTISLVIAGSAVSQDATTAKVATPTQTAPLKSEPPDLKRLAGSYTLIGNPADNDTLIKNAIDAATVQMGMFKRGVARERLQAVNKLVTRLNISSAQQNITLGMNDYVITVPQDGSSVELKTPSGELAKTSFQIKTATLVQDIVKTKGRRENTFRFNNDGNLVMQVRETSPKLASAMSYSLVFTPAVK